MFPRLSRLAPSSPLAESPLAVRPLVVVRLLSSPVLARSSPPPLPRPCCRTLAVACPALVRLLFSPVPPSPAPFRLRPCPLRLCLAPSRVRDGIAPTPRKFPAPPRADFAILLLVGAGVVRVGAIGKELGNPKRAATPRAVRFSVIRCRGFLKIPLILWIEPMYAKDVLFEGASFGACSIRVLSGSLRRCVPGRRVLFSTFGLVSVMDAGSKGASCL